MESFSMESLLIDEVELTSVYHSFLISFFPIFLIIELVSRTNRCHIFFYLPFQGPPIRFSQNPMQRRGSANRGETERSSTSVRMPQVTG